MNERNLPRTLSTNVVDALKAQGHILVVKGGATALARELSDLMAPLLAQITPRIEPYPVVGGEVTSTFGHESIDDAVEEMVATLTDALMDSEHVEDVFAEDNVIRRDIFRSLRDGLLAPAAREEVEEEADPAVQIALETLGYVAATVSKRAPAKALLEALSRAADVASAELTGYDAETRVASFLLQVDDPDARLELEEAIADELTDLVDDGSVELPTIERRVDLGRTLTGQEQRALMGRIDAAGKQTLLRKGYHATWEFETGRTLLVTFTPFSEQDARDVDTHVAAFAKELSTALGALGALDAPRPGKAAKPEREQELDRALDRDIEDEAAPEAKKTIAKKAKATATTAPVAKAKKTTAAAAKATKPAPTKRVVKTTASSSPRKSGTAAKSSPKTERATKRATKAKAPARKAPAKKR